MADIETVRIRVVPCKGNDDGVVLINKCDFDPERHELADAVIPKEAALPEVHWSDDGVICEAAPLVARRQGPKPSKEQLK